MNFGAYLKSQRDARGWTQPMAAEKIGIEQSYLSKLETGKATPSEEMFERLVNAYDIDLDALALALLLFGFGGLFVARRW
jgi:transcriptional regulator with XRE-family HTH domain